ncbi:MAG: hypothetical protein ABUL71_00215 [Gemmatimonadota bacterium]
MPELVAVLTDASVAVDTTVPGDRCTAAAALLDRWTGERSARMAGRWTQWNDSRNRALEAVRTHEEALRQRACPKASVAAQRS